MKRLMRLFLVAGVMATPLAAHAQHPGGTGRSIDEVSVTTCQQFALASNQLAGHRHPGRTGYTGRRLARLSIKSPRTGLVGRTMMVASVR